MATALNYPRDPRDVLREEREDRGLKIPAMTTLINNLLEEKGMAGWGPSRYDNLDGKGQKFLKKYYADLVFIDILMQDSLHEIEVSDWLELQEVPESRKESWRKKRIRERQQDDILPDSRPPRQDEMKSEEDVEIGPPRRLGRGRGDNSTPLSSLVGLVPWRCRRLPGRRIPWLHDSPLAQTSIHPRPGNGCTGNPYSYTDYPYGYTDYPYGYTGHPHADT